MECLLQCSLCGVVLGLLFCRPSPFVPLVVNMHTHCEKNFMFLAGLVEQRESCATPKPVQRHDGVFDADILMPLFMVQELRGFYLIF